MGRSSLARTSLLQNLFEDMLKVNFSDCERNISNVGSHGVHRWGRACGDISGDCRCDSCNVWLRAKRHLLSIYVSQTVFWISSADRFLPGGLFDCRKPHQIQSANLCFILASGSGTGPPRADQRRHAESRCIPRLGQSRSDSVRSALGHQFEVWVYTTTRTTVLSDYYYYSSFYGFGRNRVSDRAFCRTTGCNMMRIPRAIGIAT